jgi:O-antigen ligase
MVEMGILGLVGLVALLITIHRGLWHALRRSTGQTDLKMSIAFVSSWIALVLHNLMDNTWTTFTNVIEMMIFWLILAITVFHIDLTTRSGTELQEAGSNL